MTAPTAPAPSVLHSSVDDMDLTTEIVDDPHHGPSVLVSLRNTVGDWFPQAGPVECPALFSAADCDRAAEQFRAAAALARTGGA